MVIYGQDITSEITNGSEIANFHCSVHPLPQRSAEGCTDTPDLNYGGFYQYEYTQRNKGTDHPCGTTMKLLTCSRTVRMERQRFQPVRKITAGKYTIQGSIRLAMCLITTSYGRKDGRNDTRQQPSASPVPMGAPQCCPWTGSERYGFRCHRLQEMFRRTAC